MLFVIRTRLFTRAIAATRISASEMMLPFSLRDAYMSAAFSMTSSVIGRTLLIAQNLLKSLICFSAFFCLQSFKNFIFCYMGYVQTTVDTDIF